MRNGKPFCHACKEVLALKMSTIEYHINSQKHIDGKKKRIKIKSSVHMKVRFISWLVDQSL